MFSKYVDSKHGQEGENAQVLDLGFLDHLKFTCVNVVLLSALNVLFSRSFLVLHVCKVPLVIIHLKVAHELCKMSQCEEHGAFVIQILSNSQGEKQLQHDDLLSLESVHDNSSLLLIKVLELLFFASVHSFPIEISLEATNQFLNDIFHLRHSHSILFDLHRLWIQ